MKSKTSLSILAIFLLVTASLQWSYIHISSSCTKIDHFRFAQDKMDHRNRENDMVKRSYNTISYEQDLRTWYQRLGTNMRDAVGDFVIIFRERIQPPASGGKGIGGMLFGLFSAFLSEFPGGATLGGLANLVKDVEQKYQSYDNRDIANQITTLNQVINDLEGGFEGIIDARVSSFARRLRILANLGKEARKMERKRTYNSVTDQWRYMLTKYDIKKNLITEYINSRGGYLQIYFKRPGNSIDMEYSGWGIRLGRSWHDEREIGRELLKTTNNCLDVSEWGFRKSIYIHSGRGKCHKTQWIFDEKGDYFTCIFDNGFIKRMGNRAKCNRCNYLNLARSGFTLERNWNIRIMFDHMQKKLYQRTLTPPSNSKSWVSLISHPGQKYPISNAGLKSVFEKF